MFCLLTTNTFAQTEWEVNYYNDEFGDPNPSAGSYIVRVVEGGSFSNSATTNSNLSVIIFAEGYKNNIITSIKLIEYGSNIVKEYSTTPYIIKIKDDYGDVYTIKTRITEGTDIMYDFNSTIHNLMLNNKKLKFFIEEETNGYPSTYKFSFSTGNYSKVISKIKNNIIKGKSNKKSTKELTGNVKETHTFSSVYENPDMNSKVIGQVNKVSLIKKMNDSYCKVAFYDEKGSFTIGYMWIGSFKQNIK